MNNQNKYIYLFFTLLGFVIISSQISFGQGKVTRNSQQTKVQSSTQKKSASKSKGKSTSRVASKTVKNKTLSPLQSSIAKLGDQALGVRVVEINSYSDYSLNLSNVYKYAKTIGGVYACFAAEELKSTFVTRSTDAGTMNIQQLAESEFESYPGEFEEWWNEGKNYLIKFSQDDINLYFCFGVKIGNTAYFGNFSVGLSMLETDEDVDAFYDIAFLTLVGFPILNSKQDSSTYSMSSTKSNVVNGYEAVDLGLSVRWATCNVGAIQPDEFGKWFTFGDVTGRKYTNKTEDYVSGNIVGTSNDIAKHYMGPGWRMPTIKECEELVTKCKAYDVIINGIKGKMIYGPNGNSIFLPYSGESHNQFLQVQSSGSDCEFAGYWSGNSSDNYGHAIKMDPTSIVIGSLFKYYGYSVRGVTD